MLIFSWPSFSHYKRRECWDATHLNLGVTLLVPAVINSPPQSWWLHTARVYLSHITCPTWVIMEIEKGTQLYVATLRLNLKDALENCWSP